MDHDRRAEVIMRRPKHLTIVIKIGGSKAYMLVIITANDNTKGRVPLWMRRRTSPFSPSSP